MTRIKKITLIFLCMGLIMLAGCASEGNKTTEKKEANQETNDLVTDSPEEVENSVYGLVDFEANNLEGEVLTQAIFEDYDITMVNIWGTFCGPCIREMPDLQSLYENLPEGTNLVGIISDAFSDEIVEDAKELVSQTGVTYQNLIPDEVLYNFLVENVTGVPSTIFVDNKGNIIGDMVVGARSEEDYREFLNTALEELNK